MSGVDAAWLHMDLPVNELVVNAVLWFDRPLSDEIVRRAMQQRLVAQHPRFGQRVDDRGRAAWWVDVPAFDAMQQVTRSRLPAPGDLETLSRYVSRVASVPLPRDRPLWEVHIVDGFRGGCALVARMHHCIADGVALFRVLLSLSDEAQEGGLAAPRPTRPPARRSAARSASCFVVATAKITRALVGLAALPPDRSTPLRSPLG